MEKERRTKALVLSALVVVVATLSIAFAAMSRTLSINGIGKMDTASWSVYFDNLSNAKITRGAKEVGKPSISTDKGTVQDINVKLSNPKDEISYTVDIVNAGTIDAEITMIKDIELTEAQKKIFEFKVTYTATGKILKDGDVLPAGDTKNITINIKFRDDITEADLPSESQTISLSYQITYTQYDGKSPSGPNGGGVTTEKAVLASVANPDNIMNDNAEEPFFNCTTITRNQVESINFLRSNIVPTEYESTSWDASQNHDGSVMAWYTNSDSDELYEVYVGANGGVAAPENSLGLFALFGSLENINFNGNFDTSSVTNMIFMFYSCSSLTSLDLSSFNTSNVTNMSYMLTACRGLTSLDLTSFNTSKVTDMTGMFAQCVFLTSLDLNHFNTSNVTDMSSMFRECSSLTSLDLSHFDVSSVTTMEGMFYGDEGGKSKLQSINLSGWNTINVENMSDMFYCCVALTSLDLSSFDTSNVTDMGSMFAYCTSLTNLDLSNFKTSKVTDMSQMFHSCDSLTSIDLRNADFSNVNSYHDIFDTSTNFNQIIVKDEQQRTWLTSKFTHLTNVVLTSEL